MISEEKYIQNILFDKNFSVNHSKINYEKIIKFLSRNLLIPAFYSKIKRTAEANIAPKEFIDYVRYIYKTNQYRNRKLVSETEEIENILIENKIEYNFIKGAALIKEEVFENLAERMVGDIDILIKNNQLTEAINLFLKLGYNSKKEMTKIWYKRHYPKLLRPNKVFAIELHKSITDDVLKAETIILKKSNIKCKINFLIDVCILNSELNDFGYLKAVVYYKSAYDFKNLIKLTKSNYSNKNLYTKRFLQKLNSIGLYDKSLQKNFWDEIYLRRFILKREIKLYYYFDNLICDIIIVTRKRINQIKEFLFNKNYRTYVLEKLSNYF